MTRWDAARARSQQPQRRYKPVAPVGVALAADDYVCRNCGHHMCSCVRRAGRTMRFPIEEGRTHDPGHHAYSLNPANFFLLRGEARRYPPDAIARSCAEQKAAVGAERAERYVYYETVREWAAQGERDRLAFNPLWFEGDDHETHQEQHKRLLVEGITQRALPLESAGERKRPLP